MPGSKEHPTRPIGGVLLRINLWLVMHRLLMKRIFTLGLGVFCAGLYGYTIWIVIGLSRGQTAHREMMAAFTKDLIDYPSLRPLVSPKPLQAGLPLSLPAGDGVVDLAARVANPNQKFAVTALAYRFSDDQGEIAAGTTFVLPGESKYAFIFGQRNPSGELKFTLADVTWQRVRPEDFTALADTKLRAQVSGIEHRTMADLGPLGSRLGGQTIFTVRNDSIFGYWDLALYVLLENGDRLVAAHFARIRQLDPGQVELVAINWTQALPSATAVTVLPEINPFDAGGFYDYEATDNSLPR